MTDLPTISRGQLILGICLPLALLLGYLLAEPMDPSGIGLVFLVVGVLCSPLLIWWYHPLLIASWNAALWVGILPGSPMMWMLMTCGGFVIAILSRAVNPQRRFVTVPALNWVFLSIFLVVFVTAWTTGGVGMNSLGSDQYGGRKYVTILLSLMGYYVLTSRAIAPERAGFYSGMFFLPGVTYLAGNLVYMAGQGAWILFLLFPVGGAYYQYAADMSLTETVNRFAGADGASQAVWSYLLCRYGLAGVFDLRRPWLMVTFTLTVGAGLFGGFRSGLVLFGLVFLMMFFLERLWRTRLVLLFLLLGLAGAGGLALFARSLPMSAQRAISFLPVEVDPVARLDAQNSTEWRLLMWQRVWPEVPEHLFRGKGYTMNAHDMTLVEDAVRLGHASSYEMAMFAGDYHNGPLSVLLPFGIYGAAAFLALFVVGGRVLWCNWRHGPEELRRINCFLLAVFVAKTLFFLAFFGSACSDLFVFTGLLGLGVALNGGAARAEVRR